MSKIIRTSKPSVLPWYAAALVFVVLCAVLPVYQLWALLVSLGGACAAFGAAKNLPAPRGGTRSALPHRCGRCGRHAHRDAEAAGYPPRPERGPAGPEPLGGDDPNGKAGRSIVETVEASPAKAKQVRRFANYYLPDAVNVLQQYARLARQGVKGENAASIRAEVEHNAASIATAFENQLDALYAAESMDLSADLTVLQNMLKGQGL